MTVPFEGSQESFTSRRNRRASQAAVARDAAAQRDIRDRLESEINRSREDLLQPAYRIRDAEHGIDRAEEQLAALDLDQMSAGGALAFGPGWTISLCGADAAMLGATTHMVASNNFGVSLPLETAVGTSAMIAIIESLLSVALAGAREAAAAGRPGANSSYRVLLVLAGILAVALAGCAIAPFVVDGSVAGAARVPVTVFVFGLALVVHSATFANGSLIRRAYSRIGTYFRESPLRGDIRTFEREIARGHRELPRAFRRYNTSLATWRRDVGEVPDHLRLTRRDLDVVNHGLRGELALRAEETPDNPDAGATPDATAPVAPPPPTAFGEVDYLRTVLDGQLRDADGTLSGDAP